MFWITLDKEGKELFREPKPKRCCPRNGFQKYPDGNFYKILGDPRNIFDIEKKAELLKQQEEAERKKRIEEASERLKKLLPDSACKTADYDQHRLCTCLTARTKIGAGSFRSSFGYKSATLCGLPPNDFWSLRKTRLKKPIGVTSIDRMDQFEKIEIYPSKGYVKFWLFRHSGTPDYLVRDIIEQ